MKELQVVAGVVSDLSGRILLAKRPESSHQGGLWEFPGGKLEKGETPLEALRRELLEEIGIAFGSAIPLIQVRHRYPDRSILLNVFTIESFFGQPFGREGQETRWVNACDLRKFDFPKANLPIISAILLPAIWPILNDDYANPERIEKCFIESVAKGLKNLQIRCKRASAEQFANSVGPLCVKAKTLGVEVILNGDPEIVKKTGAAGVHLSSRLLMEHRERPLSDEFRVGASCHDLDELLRAQQLRVDYVFLSPVRPTASHPGKVAMGWTKFASLVNRVSVPVYALGGMTSNDLNLARKYGARGVAGIRAF